MLRCILHRILHCISYYIVWYVALYTTLYDTIHAILHAILHCRIHYRTTAYRGISSRWMCVKHLNRCKNFYMLTVSFFLFFLLLFSQQGVDAWSDTAFPWWYDGGTRFESLPFHFLYGFRNLSRWERFGLVEREGSASNWFHLALTMAMVASCFSVGLFTDPFLSGVIGNVFAHKVHSTSKFAMTILSEQVCVGLARDILNKKDLLFADV